MEASKKEIQSIQGLSVLAMLCLHLFCRYDYNGLYQPILFIGKYPLSFYFGQLSDFCVMGFAFCSGYAHYVLYNSDCQYFRNRLKSLFILIKNYWVVLIIFTLISVFIGNGEQIPHSFTEFLGNFFLIKISYNGAWWYLLTYTFIVLTSIPIIKLVQKNSIFSIIVLFIVYTISYIWRFKYPSENWFIQQIYLYGMTIFEYSLGVLFHKHKIFTNLYDLWISIQTKLKYILFMLVFVGIFLGHTLILQTLFVAPFTGLIIIIMYHLVYTGKNLFYALEIIGEHSTNIWLIHMFFYLHIFVNLVFVMKYPILIYIFFLSINIFTSLAIKQIQLFITNKI